MPSRTNQHFPIDLLFQEAASDAEAELELVTLDLCDRVRRDGLVDADSMWETGPSGRLTEDVPASRLHNLVRWRREQPERERLERERRSERARKAALEAHEARRQREAAEMQRREQYKQAVEAVKQAAEAARRGQQWAAEQERLRIERLQREAQWRAERDVAAARQSRLSEAMMKQWDELVARKGWSEGEAATRWNDWLTGPLGFFG